MYGSVAQVQCWGGNQYGQLGLGFANASAPFVGLSSPSTAAAITGATSVVTGNAFSCAVLTNGSAKCWGYGGDGTAHFAFTCLDMCSPLCTFVSLFSRLLSYLLPTLCCQVYFVAPCTVYVCGYRFARMRAESAVVSSLRLPFPLAGSLGTGVFTNLLSPSTAVSTSMNITALSAGHAHVCALSNTAGLRCWGWNALGQVSAVVL